MWLQRHKFGTYIDWVEDATGAYVTVAVERDGKLRIPSAAALSSISTCSCRCAHE